VSVGHVSRELESIGIPSVIVMSNVFRGRVLVMKPARVVFTHHIMGRPMGAPHDKERQAYVLREALKLLESATGPETTLVLPDSYRVAKQAYDSN
jgi:hypothetical protein